MYFNSRRLTKHTVPFPYLLTVKLTIKKIKTVKKLIVN